MLQITHQESKNRAHGMGENTCKLYVLDKRLVIRIHKEDLQLNHKKANNPVKKSAKFLNRYLSKEDIQMANKLVKSHSVALLTRELQIKTTARCHFTPASMTIIKMMTEQVSARMLRSWNPHALLVGMEKGTTDLGNSLTAPQKVTQGVNIPSSNSTPRYIPNRTENVCLPKTCKQMFVASLLIIAPK